jgi:hypothetical protein
VAKNHTQAGTLQPPLIIAEGLDVTMYDSIEEAELHLEADIVETSEFIGYDAAGRPLRIDTEGERVVITPGEPSSAHRERLETLLRECLEAMGWIRPRPMGYSLPELIQVGMQAGLSYRDQTRRTPSEFFGDLLSRRRGRNPRRRS